MSDANKKLIQDGFDAFGAQDMERLSELFAADVKWHTRGNNPLSGDHDGLESVLALMAQAGQGADFDFKTHSILADDEHAVALMTTTATRGDKSYSGQTVFVYHVGGGKISEVWTFNEDQASVDAFWAD